MNFRMLGGKHETNGLLRTPFFKEELMFPSLSDQKGTLSSLNGNEIYIEIIQMTWY
jgi:hypothetical protein